MHYRPTACSSHTRPMTARSEILDAVPSICDANGEFELIDAVNELRRRGSRYKESTIRTHIISRMCRDASKNHAVTYDDFAHVRPGRYRLIDWKSD
ncbi:DUF7669 domain-containing protein [Parafrankia elaeagni]